MKVDYKIPGAQGVWTELFSDSSQKSVEAFEPSFGDVVQTEPLYGSLTPFRANRGNTSAIVPLAGWITYASEGAAINSIAAMRAIFRGATVHLRVKPNLGNVICYYGNGALRSYRARVMGLSVLHQFEFETDDVSTTEP